MDINKDDLCKNFVSIHYPGIVKNEARALETLGGIRTISSVFYNKSRRLELRMRPDNVFCKPAFAIRRPVTALILKIKVKRKKKEIVKCEVIGNVVEEYRFTGLFDFQLNPTSKTESFYDKVIPNDIDIQWFKEDCPFFLQPAIFSKVDSVQSFNFSKVSTEENRPNVIGLLKRKRYGCTTCLTFENPEVPTGPKRVPSGGPWSTKIVTKETLDHLLELFVKRPMYSKSAIANISKMPHDQLKCLLPCVAYFFTNGPWRSLWVKFGYDPRKDPSARIYQTLDYRVKSQFTSDEKQKVFKKSANHSGQSARGATVIARNSGDVGDKEEDKSETSDYIFKPGIIPPNRQCIYQYCDIHVPEIQAMFENLPSAEEQSSCSEVHGWLPPGMSESCREIMNKCVAEEAMRRNELSLSLPRSLHMRNSESESDSTDGEG